MARDQLAPLGRGLPVDVAEVVVPLVLAQVLEFPALAPMGGAAAARVPGSRQGQLQVARTFARQVGQDLHALRQGDRSLPLDEAERAGNPVEDGAELKAAAPVAFQGIVRVVISRCGGRRSVIARSGPANSVGGESMIWNEGPMLALIDQLQLHLEEPRLPQDGRHVAPDGKRRARNEDHVGQDRAR